VQFSGGCGRWFVTLFWVTEDNSTVAALQDCGDSNSVWLYGLLVARSGGGCPTSRWRGEDELVDEPPPTKIYCCWCGRPVVAAGCCLGWLVTVA